MNIYKRSQKGFQWTILSNIIKGIVGFIAVIIYTYFLGPEKLGLISILTVIYELSDTVAQFGISQSIISRDKLSNNELSSIFWANEIIGLTLGLTLFLSAPLISNFYNIQDLMIPIRILSFIFIIEPIDLVFYALLEKEIKFSVTERITIIKNISILILTMIFILFGLGIKSFVYGVISGAIIDALLLLIYFIKNKS